MKRPTRPLTGRERDTILAALRLYMSLNSGELKVLDPDLLSYDQLGEIATNSGMWTKPDNDFIDELCCALNGCGDMECGGDIEVSTDPYEVLFKLAEIAK